MSHAMPIIPIHTIPKHLYILKAHTPHAGPVCHIQTLSCLRISSPHAPNHAHLYRRSQHPKLSDSLLEHNPYMFEYI